VTQVARGPDPFRADTRRAVSLFRSFRVEQTDPSRFYRDLAADSAAQVGSYADLRGARLLDVGGGPGFFQAAFEQAGATYVGLDADAGEMRLHGREPGVRTVQGDGMALPFATGAFDVTYSSNVAEHVPDPWRLADELVRVTRPGGVVFLSYTVWFGPWGGHETAPWHFLGGEYAARRYERRQGKPPKNRYGESLYRVTVSDGLRWAARQQEAEVIEVLPRYLPHWARWVVGVPGLRELATWNLSVVLKVRA
jgi:SAM-dependent methyltransferase